jgi:hypothetical protein
MGWSLDSLAKRKKLKAAKKAEKRAAHPSSAARIVRQQALTEPDSSMRKTLGSAKNCGQTDMAKHLLHYDTQRAERHSHFVTNSMRSDS